MTDNGLIYVYWVACRSCDHETAAHGRVACPDCGETMAPFAIAGAVVDDLSENGGNAER